MEAWPPRPFAVPIPIGEPDWCIVYFDDIGTTNGGADETSDLLDLINTRLIALRALRPTSNARPFSLSTGNVKVDLVLFRVQGTRTEIITGVLEVYDNYVANYGARNVRSLISCEARAYGRISVQFTDTNANQGHGLISMNENVSSTAVDSTE